MLHKCAVCGGFYASVCGELFVGKPCYCKNPVDSGKVIDQCRVIETEVVPAAMPVPASETPETDALATWCGMSEMSRHAYSLEKRLRAANAALADKDKEIEQWRNKVDVQQNANIGLKGQLQRWQEAGRLAESLRLCANPLLVLLPDGHEALRTKVRTAQTLLKEAVINAQK